MSGKERKNTSQYTLNIYKPTSASAEWKMKRISKEIAVGMAIKNSINLNKTWIILIHKKQQCQYRGSYGRLAASSSAWHTAKRIIANCFPSDQQITITVAILFRRCLIKKMLEKC